MVKLRRWRAWCAEGPVPGQGAKVAEGRRVQSCAEEGRYGREMVGRPDSVQVLEHPTRRGGAKLSFQSGSRRQKQALQGDLYSVGSTV